MSAKTSTHDRWLIETVLELRTPMHLGTGQSELKPGVEQDAWLAGIVLDQAGKPCIPGASLKGALRALAERHELLNDLQAVFGAVSGDSTIAGQAEFRYATCGAAWQEEIQPHVAIDRVTGTAADKKLFMTRLVPAGTRFVSQIVLHRVSQQQVEALLALLELARQDSAFTLGSHASQGLGGLNLYGKPKALRFGLAEAAQWLKQGGAMSWEKHAKEVTLASATGAEFDGQLSRKLPSLPLKLSFHSPFLVNGGVVQRDSHDITVPMLRNERVILPASSLRGRLRSQAERILRTLGIPVSQGHEAQPWQKGTSHSDLAALLFGSAGWRAIIGAGECIDVASKSNLRIQELLAIDRFTGGGKDGAKFTIEAAECPTLAGPLRFDFRRLKKLGEEAYWPALGLFTLVLRDLAEGDIAFGYGIAKGYGQCRESGILVAWETLLADQFPEQSNPVEHALEALRCLRKTPVTGSQPLQVNSVSQESFDPKAESGDFLNPYHFIPLSKPDVGNWTSPEELQEKRGHDHYHGLSGRITCTLTSRTPLFIGAKRREGRADEPASLDGYEFKGKPAIPATSLRGMISSLFESISSSGFRVLHPQPYSMRKTEGSLSAMGRIIVQDKKVFLKPLTLPTLKKGRGDSYPLDAKWKKIAAFNFENTEGYAPLRVYFDTNDKEKYQQSGPFYMELLSVEWDAQSIERMAGLRHPSRKNRDTRETEPNFDFLIGQKPQGSPPISEEEYHNLPAKAKEAYFPGWVRTLETPERPKGANALLPSTVKHLVFLPDLTTDKAELLLAMTPSAYHTFHKVADLATASMPKDRKVNDGNLLPFVPAGREQRNDRLLNPETHFTRLQHGDLVFFDVDDNGKVSEISFSSMWRTGIKKAGSRELATTADLLAQYDPNLLPLGMGDRKASFSPADLLFGTVEYRPPASKKSKPNVGDEKQALALAGRVQIGIGETVAADITTDPAVTLKELASPKPPSPALYFKPLKNVDYVSKLKLAQSSGDYTLQGRKTYLHAWRNEQGEVVRLDDQGLSNDERGRFPWVSKHDGQPDGGHKRRVKVKPISTDQTFTFNIDFHNLSERELQQLCATLQPDPAFEHRLGMGKPLGLGSVKVQISAVSLIHRQNRYQCDKLSEERFHQVLTPEEINTLAAAGMKLVTPGVRRALQLLGNPVAVTKPVHYPQVEGGTLENEHFKWFMANDDTTKNAPANNQQGLKALTDETDSLPTLIRLKPKEQKPDRSSPGGLGQRGGTGKRW